MAKANHSARYRSAMVDENVRLQRRVNDLEASIDAWQKWATPISMAIMQGDNLRAIALMKGGRNGKTQQKTD